MTNEESPKESAAEPLTAREQASQLAAQIQDHLADLNSVTDDAINPGDRRPPVVVEALMRDTQSILAGIAGGHIPVGQRTLASNWIRLVDELDRAGFSELGSDFAQLLSPLSRLGLTIDGLDLGITRFADRVGKGLQK